MSKKYIPGQRLNSAAEVMQALLDGEKLTDDGTDFNGVNYVHLAKGQVVDETGVRFGFDVEDAWYIYTPPKRKVKSERWFAVERVLGEIRWSLPFPSEGLAKHHAPNALAYVKAECEVEVDE